MLQQIVIPSLSEIDAAAEEFLRRLGDRRLVAFHAAMGAGKTTFTTALCRRLGVDEDAVSIKATTTERLGFEGREEGISASCVCLIEKAG